MRRLETRTRVAILNMLVEGSSMRSVRRVTGTSIDTVDRLLVSVGKVCREFHNEHVDNVNVEGHNIQLDEQWASATRRRRTSSAGALSSRSTSQAAYGRGWR